MLWKFFFCDFFPSFVLLANRTNIKKSYWAKILNFISRNCRQLTFMLWYSFTNLREGVQGTCAPPSATAPTYPNSFDFISNKMPVADPGFPRNRASTLLKGARTHDFAKTSQKLNEIERIFLSCVFVEFNSRL